MAMAAGIRPPYQPRPPHFQPGPGMHAPMPPPSYGAHPPGQMQRYQAPPPPQLPTGPDQADVDAYNAKMFEYRQDLDAKRLRKSIYRKTVDYFTPVIKYLEVCLMGFWMRFERRWLYNWSEASID